MSTNTLEHAIQQPHFRSEYQKVAINIFYTATWLSNRHRDLFKRFDVTTQQFNILRILRGQKGKPLSVNALIERMIEPSSNASRLVDKLVDKKLVERTTCPDDRRQVEVRILEDGLALLTQIDPHIEAMDQKFSHLTLDEARLLNQLLDKLRQQQ
jgi:DNA-binding MarR family transcriptional regulator